MLIYSNWLNVVELKKAIGLVCLGLTLRLIDKTEHTSCFKG